MSLIISAPRPDGSPYELNAIAEQCIQVMSLNKDERNEIRRCIYCYTVDINSADSDSVRWFFYSLINMVKSLFGCSDWDRAVTILKNRAHEIGKGLNIPEAVLNKKITSIADDILVHCLECNQGLHVAARTAIFHLDHTMRRVARQLM